MAKQLPGLLRRAAPGRVIWHYNPARKRSLRYSI